MHSLDQVTKGLAPSSFTLCTAASGNCRLIQLTKNAKFRRTANTNRLRCCVTRRATFDIGNWSILPFWMTLSKMPSIGPSNACYFKNQKQKHMVKTIEYKRCTNITMPYIWRHHNYENDFQNLVVVKRWNRRYWANYLSGISMSIKTSLLFTVL